MKINMQKGRIIITAWIFAIAMGMQGFSQDNPVPAGPLSLQQCVEIALKNNIPLQQNTLLIDAAKGNLDQAKASLLPNLNGNWGYNWNTGRTIDPFTNGYIDQKYSSSSAGLNSGIILSQGLQLQNAIKQTSYAYQATKEENQQQKDNLTLNVIMYYLMVLNSEDLLEISKEQSTVTQGQVDRTKILVDEGQVGSYQLSDLKGQLAGEQMTIVNNQVALETAKLNLCQAMNIPYTKDLKLQRLDDASLLEIYGASSDQVYNAALTSLAQVKAVDLRAKSAQKGLAYAKGGYFPQLSLNGGLSTNYSSIASISNPTTTSEISTGDYVYDAGVKNPVLRQQQNYSNEIISYGSQFKNNVGTYVGFYLSVPIFNNLRVRNRVIQARVIERTADLEAKNTRLVLKQSVEQAHQNMESAYERLKISNEQVLQFQESFRSAEIRFNEGTIVSTDYLIVKNSLDRAKVNLAQTRYEYIFRTKILDFYQGKQLW
ncbi:MAG: TolC family protein [Bacteroidetes bacterium]|nr:MAG: TolC family protein [Bacteroidota bacterium]